MPTSDEYLEYVLDLLRDCHGITYRKMMGEYLLYLDDVLFGGVYDNRFLLKEVMTNKKFALKETLPYPNGSKMYIVASEDPQEVKELVELTCEGIKKLSRKPLA